MTLPGAAHADRSKDHTSVPNSSNFNSSMVRFGGPSDRPKLHSSSRFNSSMVRFGGKFSNVLCYSIYVSIPVWCDLER